MNAAVAAAIASGVTSLAGNVIQNYSQDLRDAKAREWQEMMVDEANAYNHPAAVMARMKQAGLNPNLLTGQPVQGSAPVPQASHGSRSASFDDIAPNVINAIMQERTLELQENESKTRLQNETALAEAEINLKKAEEKEIRSRTPGEGKRTIAELAEEGADADNALKGSQKKSIDDENARKQGEYDFQATLREWHRRSVIAKVRSEEVGAKYAEQRAIDEHLAAQAGLRLSAAELYSKFDDVAESLIYADVLHYDSASNKWVVDDKEGLAEKLFYRGLGLSPNVGNSTRSMWKRFKTWLKDAFRNPPDKDGNRAPAIGDWFTDEE